MQTFALLRLSFSVYVWQILIVDNIWLFVIHWLSKQIYLGFDWELKE